MSKTVKGGFNGMITDYDCNFCAYMISKSSGFPKSLIGDIYFTIDEWLGFFFD